MERIGEKDAKELDDAGKEDVSLRSGGVGGLSMGHAKHRHEGVDGTLHRNPLDAESAPVVRTAEDTRVKALAGIWVDINAPPIGGGGAGLVTAAVPGDTIVGLDALGLWTDKFETHRAVLAPANAVKGHGDVVSGAKRDAVLIQISGAGLGSVTRVDGDYRSLEPIFPSSAPYSS